MKTKKKCAPDEDTVVSLVVGGGLDGTLLQPEVGKRGFEVRYKPEGWDEEGDLDDQPPAQPVLERYICCSNTGGVAFYIWEPLIGQEDEAVRKALERALYNGFINASKHLSPEQRQELDEREKCRYNN